MDDPSRIERLFSSSDKKIADLTQDEIDDLNEINKDINKGLVTRIVSSLKEYVDKHPELRSKTVPGTLGALLLGCENSSSECFLEEKNIFVIGKDGILQHILVKPSLDAILYLENGAVISKSHEEELAIKGISNYDVYAIDGSKISSSDNTNILLIIAVLVIILLASFFVFPLMK